MKHVATSFLLFPNQESKDEEQPAYNNLLLPTRPLQRYLLDELPRRNVSASTLGKFSVPLMAGIIQEAVSDFGLYKGTCVDYERYSTHLSSSYLLHEDRCEIVEHCRLMISNTVHDYMDTTYLEYPWYYQLPTFSHLLLSIDKRDFLCSDNPSESQDEVVSTPSPFNIW